MLLKQLLCCLYNQKGCATGQMFRSHSCVLHLRQSCTRACYEGVQEYGTTAPHILKDAQKQLPKDSNLEAIILCSLQNSENNSIRQTFRKKERRKKQNKSKLIYQDYVQHTSFMVLGRLNVKIFHLTIMMPHTDDPLIKYFQLSIELLGPPPPHCTPLYSTQIGGREAVKWGTLVVRHTSSLYRASTLIL